MCMALTWRNAKTCNRSGSLCLSCSTPHDTLTRVDPG